MPSQVSDYLTFLEIGALASILALLCSVACLIVCLVVLHRTRPAAARPQPAPLPPAPPGYAHRPRHTAG